MLSSLLCLKMVEYCICVMWMNDSPPYEISICRISLTFVTNADPQIWENMFSLSPVHESYTCNQQGIILLWASFVENPMTCKYIKIFWSHFPLIQSKSYCMCEPFSCRMNSWLVTLAFLKHVLYPDSTTMSQSLCSTPWQFYCLALCNLVDLSFIDEYCSCC